jgi:dephospho-CoA kinase
MTTPEPSRGTGKVPGHQPFTIGLTGSIATGKSTVLALLRELGARTIDADQVYHQLIAPGQPLYNKLVERWGPRIVNNDGTINRRALGQIVFNDPAELAVLDAITHPVIMEAIERERLASDAPVVVIDAVKLIESGHADRCDQVWLVTCDPAIQRQRLIENRGLTPEEADSRLASQPPIGPRLERADVVIDNSNSIEETRRQVLAAWEKVQAAIRARSAPSSSSTSR